MPAMDQWPVGIVTERNTFIQKMTNGCCQWDSRRLTRCAQSNHDNIIVYLIGCGDLKGFGLKASEVKRWRRHSIRSVLEFLLMGSYRLNWGWVFSGSFPLILRRSRLVWVGCTRRIAFEVLVVDYCPSKSHYLLSLLFVVVSPTRYRLFFPYIHNYLGRSQCLDVQRDSYLQLTFDGLFSGAYQYVTESTEATFYRLPLLPPSCSEQHHLW